MMKINSFIYITVLVIMIAACAAPDQVSVTVSYNGNNSDSGTVPDSSEHSASTLVSVSGNTGGLTKTVDDIVLYFDGWNTEADGSGTAYPVSSTFTVGSSNVVLYAQWPAVYGTGPAGGIIFYVDSEDDFSWTYLEAAPFSTEWTDIEWGSHNGTTGTATGATGTALGDGSANTLTAAVWLDNNSETNRAAQVCNDLSIGIYGDWFLPSRDELNLMYEILYLQDFGNLSYYYYWSSTEVLATHASAQYFNSGNQTGMTKIGTFRVRAIRAF